MAKAKKTVKKNFKRPAGRKILKKRVDNRLSIGVLVLAILIFVLAALSMS